MKLFERHELDREFNSSDIGKTFWRVEYGGRITECTIRDVNEKEEAVIGLCTITQYSDDEYLIRPIEERTSGGTSTYGMKYLRKDTEYYLTLETAMERSLARYNLEVNPHGQYKVARYFDDVFETYMKDPQTREDLVYNKKDARAEASRLNALPRAYVSYQIRAVG